MEVLEERSMFRRQMLYPPELRAHITSIILNYSSLSPIPTSASPNQPYCNAMKTLQFGLSASLLRPWS